MQQTSKRADIFYRRQDRKVDEKQSIHAFIVPSFSIKTKTNPHGACVEF